MLGNAPFYNRTIRRIVVAFGTLFNDIQCVRHTQSGIELERWKVPLSYGAKEKYLTRLTSDPTLTKSIATLVPRISFNMESMSYDPTRKQVTTLQNFSGSTSTKINTQYAPIPYNFEFSLSIYVRNTEDGTQILEQILPFFTPDFTVTVNFNPDMDQKYDVPIILNSVNSTVDYEGDFMTTRLILWDLDFTVKGYIWPPVKSGKIIRSANTNLYIDNNNKQIQKIKVDYANGFGVFAQGETIRDKANGIFGTVEYFSNTSTGILVATGLNKTISIGNKLTGDYSNAVFNVASLSSNAIEVTNIMTRPNPIDAMPDDEFGFSETFITYPDTL